MAVELGAGGVTPEQVVLIARGADVELAPGALDAVAAARTVVDDAVAAGAAVYGLTTRLGEGRDDRLDTAELAAFQRRVIANHRGGAGEPLVPEYVRATLAARVAVLLNGGSGVRPELVTAAVSLLRREELPAVPSLGSVGAADLTVLAELLAALVDDGFEPAAGEAAAFLSSNALSVGVGSVLLDRLEGVARGADRAVALTLEALAHHGRGGSLTPFDHAVQQAHPVPGQIASAERIRSLTRDVAVLHDQRERSVQDPLSVRTAPQVNGALLDLIGRLREQLALELASRSENPLVDAASGRTLSGGNFAITSLVLTVESLRLALAHVAAASERRIALLSELQRPFRADGRSRLPGLSWYAAADALAELRQLAAPVSLGASVLSGVEDTASFGPAALRLLERSIALSTVVLSVEALHGVELVRLAGRTHPWSEHLDADAASAGVAVGALLVE
ncbi:aromatic amino acid lyase [Rathayibacter sp. YIM 133350]|uniref:aromatic amino acid lyase n=1 Tax=Rathayibacter sp. YIM 133350 TaxID=3131992 RepID=UPI00307F87BD